jgi:hypothetical protein
MKVKLITSTEQRVFESTSTSAHAQQARRRRQQQQSLKPKTPALSILKSSVENQKRKIRDLKNALDTVKSRAEKSKVEVDLHLATQMLSSLKEKLLAAKRAAPSMTGAQPGAGPESANVN